MSPSPPSTRRPTTEVGPSHDNKAKAADRDQAEREKHEASVSEPGGFANDPDEANNPNEAIERSRRQVRP